MQQATSPNAATTVTPNAATVTVTPDATTSQHTQREPVLRQLKAFCTGNTAGWWLVPFLSLLD